MIRKRQTLAPDLTPLIDVVFILLIFFIVSSVFKKNELALMLNLPSSNAQEVELKPKESIIELSPNKLALKGQVLSLKELEMRLKELNKDQNIIFRIDEEVQYKKIVQILDLLEKYKLTNLLLITQKAK